MTRFAIASAVLSASTLAVCLGSQPTTAQNPTPTATQSKDFILAKVLQNKVHVEKSVGDALLKGGLPEPLATDAKDWDKQEEHTIIVRNKFVPTPVKQQVNSGFWRRVTVSAPDKKNIAFALTNAKKIEGEAGRYSLTAEICMDCAIELDVQDWLRGVKVIGGKAEATCRAKLTIECEMNLAPVLFRPSPTLKVTNPKVTDTKLAYENLTAKKLGAGIVHLSGKPAEYFTDKLIAAVKKVKPTLESELLDKANAGLKEKIQPLLVKAVDKLEFSEPAETSEEKKN